MGNGPLKRLVGAGRQDQARDLGGAVDLAQAVRLRVGEERLFTALQSFLAERDLVDLDREFTRALVSNPAAGELVKGHAIVLAELGLGPFRGTVLRDPHLFAGSRSRARRAEHLIARMAFAQQLLESVIAEPVTLYRAVASDGRFVERPPASLLSCTFSEQVAAAHFAGGPATRTAAIWRQVVSPSRLVMTFLETREMSVRFREAEAVIVADPANLAF